MEICQKIALKLYILYKFIINFIIHIIELLLFTEYLFIIIIFLKMELNDKIDEVK